MEWRIRPDELKASAQAAASNAIGMAAKRTYEESQPHVPVLTGHLKASGKVVQEEPLEAAVTYDADYAASVEYGKVGRPPKPYLGKAVADLGSHYERILADEAKATFLSGRKRSPTYP